MKKVQPKKDIVSGMRPNVMQRRPNTPKHSPAKNFNLYKQQGR